MLMYHPKMCKPISVHPEQAVTLRNRGWTDKPPETKKKLKAKPKAKPIPAQSTNEVNSNG